MRRSVSLSVAVALVLGSGAVLAQSRSVSTADMPKPGVSYISGPSAPVRKETVSTGSLPQPARLYVGGQVSVGGGGYQTQDGYGNSVSESGYYYGGGYPPGYGYDNGGYGHDGYGDHGGGHGYPGHGGHDDGPGHGHGGGHDHDGRPGRGGSSLTLAAPPGNGGNHGNVSGGGVRLAPDRPSLPIRGYRDDRGWNNAPPIQPGTGVTNGRFPQPGTGMGNGNQPGTGVPMHGGWRGNGR